MSGTVSTCERSESCRYEEQAKDADKLEPKGNVAGRGSGSASLVDMQRHRQIERTYPTRLLTRNTETPYPSQRGKRPVRGADRDAGKGTRKKRRPPGNGVDRGCN